MISVTRRYRFCASHRLHSIMLSEMENARVYGKCNNPYGHGHDYTLDVTASGPLDAVAGQLFPHSHLDRLVTDHVLSRFDHRNLNVDVFEFEHLVPTTENAALVIANRLRENWDRYINPAAASLTRVYIQETGRNSFEVLLPLGADGQSDARELERKVTVHA